MKKKFLYTVAAAAAILAANPVAEKAAAAGNAPANAQKEYYYHTGTVTYEQFNSIMQKYFQNPQLVWGQQKAAPQQTPAQQQPGKVQQPAQAQKPAPAPVKQPAQSAPAASQQVSAYEQKVVQLTNEQRAKHGLPALKLDAQLSKVAKEKSLDMQRKGYFSHTSPTYGSPFDMMKKFGITYRAAGENIAKGQRSPEEVVNAWMNSDGHRKNILNSSYTHIGVGHVAQGNYWTQMFIGK
ncbi:CAP domain-containing protein [Bacillus sp. T33-2]|uniref:CAP domain-containing protein n=1 Tax=Bacillus sp. T33-2 TaxID=2054168 RepID=UPI000C75ED77|nr:CAP domain-containing protein [Bacillus sp. T33-2]PLR98856.1 sporulation protein [Bacillus sp. T33-2]